MIARPSIGRLVLYRPASGPADVRPAVIVKVGAGLLVDLHVLGPTIPPGHGGNLPTGVDHSEAAVGNTWCWWVG